MSTANAEGQAQAALDAFLIGTYQPAFFGRLKQAGVVPANQHEAEQLLTMGGRLFAGHQGKQAGQAEKMGSLLDLAMAELEGPAAAPEQAIDRYAKQAAQWVASDPALAAAGALVVDMYEAS